MTPSALSVEERILRGLDDRRFRLMIVVTVALVHAATAWQFDLRTWDESLYAHRVLAIVAEGSWLDQTASAEQGLWSAAHPPLLIWAMAISALAFGLDELSLRFPSLLASLGTCMVLYKFAAVLDGRQTGWLTLPVYLSVPFVTDLTRRAQLDGGALFFMTLSLYLICTPAPGRAPTPRALASGVALGLGLMSKLAVAALVPISLLAFLLWQQLRREPDMNRAWWAWLLQAGLGAAIAAPWYGFMMASHGAAYWEQAFGYHVLERMMRPLEGHTSSLGVLYWPLQTIVHLGPVAPFVAVGVWRWNPVQPVMRRLALCWLAVPATTFCIVATVNDSYFLMFALPVVFFATVGLRLFLERRIPASWTAGTVACVFASLCWSVVEPLRSGVEGLAGDLRAASVPSLTGITAVVALLGLILTLWAAARGRHGRTVAVAASGVLALSPIYGCSRLVRPQTSEWHGIRRAIDAEQTGRTLDLFGEVSLKARLYERVIDFDADRADRPRPVAPDCVVTQDEALAMSLEERYPQRQKHGDLVLLCGCCSAE